MLNTNFLDRFYFVLCMAFPTWIGLQIVFKFCGLYYDIGVKMCEKKKKKKKKKSYISNLIYM
jgi:hypothetical protein